MKARVAVVFSATVKVEPSKDRKSIFGLAEKAGGQKGFDGRWLGRLDVFVNADTRDIMAAKGETPDLWSEQGREMFATFHSYLTDISKKYFTYASN